ncbi:uncharacterized protein BDW43DRAFT_322432 [Aspergillus alliaceus]|uniref:uncharacterized protein n=1 Tax=Petromyces alliaceus TaxID=209559 RepID=UPI0012A6EDBD|nr:uncharacterized protein BDW43DRAFT_322432 [Aspergillus alliaceus]KAB8229004.1 hypothetical protein BDW43DRAFT_322432 [Aspergillus alliaceus]
MGARTFSFTASITALVGFLIARTAHAASFRWYVNASSALGGVVWLACAYFMPSQAATGCIGAALAIGINAVIHAHGGTGLSDALIPTRNAVDAVSFVHTTHEGVIHNFINTTALTYDWHHVHAIDQPMNLTVPMLPGGRVHARTLRFDTMDCDADCPNKKPSQLDSQATKYKIEEIDFAWSARKGYAYSTDGTVAHIGSNYYGDKYAPDIPPAC